MTDYRTFRLSKINEAEFCHLKRDCESFSVN